MSRTVKTMRMEISGHRLPVKVHRERRRNIRAAVGKESFILRMPHRLSARQEEEGMEWFRNWAEKAIQRNAALVTQFNGRTYRDGEVIRVGKRSYRLRLRYADRKTHAGRLHNGVIELDLSNLQSGPELSKSIRTLLSRIIGQDFLPEITRRAHALNDRHFQKKINGVRLKYNHSNWGSCSNNGNINLSTRLLFAPDPVIDYVIIHELAHLREMNHSTRFWALVAKAMPDYEKKERWLKNNRDACDF